MIGAMVTRRNLSLGPGTVIGETARRRNLSLGPGPVIGAMARRRNISVGPGPVIGAMARRRDLSLGPGPVIGGERKRFRGGRRYMQTGNQDYHGHQYNIGRSPSANAWFPLIARHVRYAQLFHDNYSHGVVVVHRILFLYK